MKILGINHSNAAAAALVVDGRVLAASQEERFTRLKHDAGFPDKAIDYCLKSQGLKLADLDAIGFFWNPGIAAAFFTSPFEEAAILTADGYGERQSTTIYRGQAGSLELLAEVDFPHSIGSLYAALTDYLGFRANSGEGMGLASYGHASEYVASCASSSPSPSAASSWICRTSSTSTIAPVATATSSWPCSGRRAHGRGRAHHRLVPGPRRVRATRARQPVDCGRSAAQGHEGSA